MKNIKKALAFYYLLIISWGSFGIMAVGCNDSEPIAGFSGKYVNDQAGLLSEEQATQLESILSDYDEKQNFQCAAVTVPSLAGQDLSALSLELFREMGIGISGINNGCLILIAMKERRVKIDIGYGLEWEVPDSVSKVILDQQMLPMFKEGNYFGGLKTGFESIYNQATQVSWDVNFPEWASFPQGDSTAFGKIVRFQAKSVAQRPASTMMDKQFDPSFEFQVQTPDEQIVNVRFSQYMLDLVERVHAWGNGRIYGRVISVQPLEVNLLGIEEF
ncbi:MAG: TPM domain-containing protein, partial [Bacteroidetes bacterium]|nr:TPM domain-containing protein [Bacteroidota bacterium]